MKNILLITLIFLVFLPGCFDSEQDIVKDGEVTTIKIAAFNIQIFGKSKRAKPEVMEVLVDIAREFDIIFVQEIRDRENKTALFYLDTINAVGDLEYAMIESNRLGRTSSKEAYAYFYNISTVEFIPDSDYVWNDISDVFEREPYIASFRSRDFDFTLAGIHVKPDDAEAEIGELATVYSSILQNNPDEEDIIIMGDFNADGSYFDEDSSSPLKTDGFTWTITNDMDTMTKTDWTYDRIVITDATDREFDRAGVFYFDTIFGIVDQEFTEDVSDHFPVYSIFRTGLPDDD